jgi:hypothetical protein
MRSNHNLGIEYKENNPYGFGIINFAFLDQNYLAKQQLNPKKIRPSSASWQAVVGAI